MVGSVSGSAAATGRSRRGTRTAAPFIRRLAETGIVATIVWGALAFGAVYPWAYWPLTSIAAIAGVAGLLVTDAKWGRHSPSSSGSVSFGFKTAVASVAGVIGVQLVPIPISAFSALNPNAISLLQRFEPAVVLGAGQHALSVWPPGTELALILFGALAVLMLGTARLTSVTGPRRLVWSLIITGVALALIGIVQKSLFTGKLYGFWITQEGGNPFGPFVNKNHFAGWMLMAIPVALGYLCQLLAGAMRGVRPEWRDRLLWFSSPDANKLIMVATGIAVMWLALLMTLSRSGISALALAFTIMGWFALRRLRGRSRKMLASAYLVLLATLLVAWVGLQTITTHFSEPNWREFNGRRGTSADALSAFKLHWLTGTGVNTYQVVNLFYQQHDKESFVSAAHNDYLQLAAEGGVVLVSVVAACIFVFVRDIRRRFREDGDLDGYWLRAGTVAGLLAIALQETVEFSLQIPGNAALFAVLCGIALHRPSRAHLPQSHPLRAPQAGTPCDIWPR